MRINDALRQYQTGLFTDGDMTRCTGLSVRSWRELIKIGAVRTREVGHGRGRVRLCDPTTLKRAAAINALNTAGFSLAVAGRIAYHLPQDELLYSRIDPLALLSERAAGSDREAIQLSGSRNPARDWFDPSKPAIAEPIDDWFIEIVDCRFVGVRWPGEKEPMIYGDLRDGGALFVSWFPSHRIVKHFPNGKKSRSGRPKWGDPENAADQLSPAYLEYTFEDHSAPNDPLKLAAATAFRSPTSKLSVDVSLVIRKALRRYLGVEDTAQAGACDDKQERAPPQLHARPGSATAAAAQTKPGRTHRHRGTSRAGADYIRGRDQAEPS
jgi:hypothetical protein